MPCPRCLEGAVIDFGTPWPALCPECREADAQGVESEARGAAMARSIFLTTAPRVTAHRARRLGPEARARRAEELLSAMGAAEALQFATRARSGFHTGSPGSDFWEGVREHISTHVGRELLA